VPPTTKGVQPARETVGYPSQAPASVAGLLVLLPFLFPPLFPTPNPDSMLIKEDDENASSNDYGFPPGCFVLRSVSSGRMLDVASDSVQDSSPIILWPEKDNSLVESKSPIVPDLFHTELTNG